MANENDNIDWFQLIIQINRCGIGSSDLAVMVGVPRSTLLGWKQGAEPSYKNGEKVIAAWERITGKNQAEIPRVSKSDWWAYHSS